jgi:VIT1/CCC1 family predicted Fe2+/Mn2+ transporter
MPFLISDVHQALAVAYPVVAAELVIIAWVRRRYLGVALARSLVQVTLSGILIATVGALVGHA